MLLVESRQDPGRPAVPPQSRLKSSSRRVAVAYSIQRVWLVPGICVHSHDIAELGWFGSMGGKLLQSPILPQCVEAAA